MPFQPIVPTWLAWNNANFTSPTALTDLRTGQPFAAGGLNLGDYFDATNEEAFQGSYTTNGLLYAGRYRLIGVDSGATAANVKTGTIGYLKNGSTVKTAIVVAVGTGQTAGTYSISATGGGGSGATVQVVVGSAGTITSATVLTPGYGYQTVPTLSLTSIGGSGGSVILQLNTSPNFVGSYDQTVTNGFGPGTVRPVVFLNSITPGNYGFIQELGTATVLGAASVGDNTIGDWVDSTTAGLVVARPASNSPIGATIGRAVDSPQNSSLFKVVLNGPVVQD